MDTKIMTDSRDTTDEKSKKQAERLKRHEKKEEGTPKKEAVSPTPPANTLKFPETPPKDYDCDVIDDFLDAVFHAGTDEDEHILTWMVRPTASPSYPKTDEKLLDILAVTKQPKALYFATSTCTHDEDGKLYHRKSLFRSLRVVVLDDIGTKIPVDKIPEDFPPSYIVESSEGNYQYGYILDEPVRDLAAAEALIQLVYEAGYSDEGGKTPVKLVRLPEGVNGKKGVKCNFPTTVKSLTRVTYSPQTIFDKLKLNVKWEDVLADADSVTKKRASRSLGATPWADISPQAQSMNGFIDPVLEWLYDGDQVALDNHGQWVEIRCPWSEGHTTGKETAGYAPLGRGDDVECRGFKCFHEHCAGKNTVDFLQYIAANSGIQAGVRDPAAKLTTQYVFDKVQNAVWDVKSDRRDMRLPMTAFANLYPHKTKIQTVEGNEKLVPMTSLWSTSPSRVIVAGGAYDPTTTARIIEQNHEKYVNLFSIPDWGHGPIDRVHVDQFEEYLEYLIPDKASRDYFQMWLAAKIQDMSFRGAAIVMVAHRQGVGRSTLADMIKTLMGAANTADVPLNTMVGEGAFNEWQEKPFIVSEETLAGDPKNHYNTYEKLKTYIDPRSRTITINPKFGMKREVSAYGSYLFLTNHEHAIALSDGDRRFFVLQNADIPAPPSYFTKINNWLSTEDTDGMPLWARSVYRWLLTRHVNIEALTAPPPSNDAKREMVKAAVGDIDFAVLTLLDLWPDPYITANDVFQVFGSPQLAGAIHFDEDINKKFIKRIINRSSKACGATPVRDHTKGGKQVRPRVLITALGKEGVVDPSIDKGDVYDVVSKHYLIRDINFSELSVKVYDILEMEGRV